MAWLLAAATGAFSQAPPPYVPVGAPTAPKVSAHWNRFYDYAATTDFLKKLVAAHPHVARLESLGKSFGDRDLWLLTIAEFEAGDHAGDNTADGASTTPWRQRPAMWIDGGIHANEVQSVETVLYTAWYLLEMRSQNEHIARLLHARTFYLAPMLSPDSREAHFDRPNSMHTPRGGQRPVDDDRDGLVDEDGYDDLDGDGSITAMRVKDPNGTYRPHDEFPQLLVPLSDADKERLVRDPDAFVRYRILGQEGIDNDGDGRVNEDGDGYYDPNRNWPMNWQPEYVQRGAHRYPLSVYENRVFADFIRSRPQIAAGQSYHNTGGMILQPPGVKAFKVPREDQAVFDAIANRGIEMMPGYRHLKVAEDLYEGHGIEIDWLYGMQGIYSYTHELFTPFNYFRQTSEDGGFLGTAEQRRKFARLLLFGEGVAKWTAVDHPTYGKIEVGGLKKHWGRQPPSFLLEEELHRNTAFTLYHADQMPLVRVQSIEEEALEGGMRQITAVIENPKLTPSGQKFVPELLRRILEVLP